MMKEEELKEMKEDVVKFVEAVGNVELSGWQQKFLTDIHKIGSPSLICYYRKRY